MVGRARRHGREWEYVYVQNIYVQICIYIVYINEWMNEWKLYLQYNKPSYWDFKRFPLIYRFFRVFVYCNQYLKMVINWFCLMLCFRFLIHFGLSLFVVVVVVFVSMCPLWVQNWNFQFIYLRLNFIKCIYAYWYMHFKGWNTEKERWISNFWIN